MGIIRKNFLILICMSAALLACGGCETSGVESSTYSNAITSATPGHSFSSEYDREIFERERQLWIEQDIQNYSFAEMCGSPGFLGNPSALPVVYVKNGVAIFSREKDFFGDDRTYYPDNTSNAFFASLSPVRLILSISDIYAEIERFANDDNTIGIQIRYHSGLHYPAYVCIIKGDVASGDKTYRSVEISRFVIDPDIPDG